MLVSGRLIPYIQLITRVLGFVTAQVFSLKCCSFQTRCNSYIFLKGSIGHHKCHIGPRSQQEKNADSKQHAKRLSEGEMKHRIGFEGSLMYGQFITILYLQP